MMLKKCSVAVSLFAVMFGLTGCVANMFPGGPVPSGGLVTSVRAPAQMLSVALDPTAKPVKEGKATAGAFLGIIAAGDSSVEAAMKNGQITRIHHVDHEVNTFLLGLWAGSTTIVYGE